MTEDEKRFVAVHHVVHDYTNFVSSGEEIFKSPPPPLNTHVQHVFLLNCRKMFDFFSRGSNGKDSVAADFFPLKKKPPFRFPFWKDWGTAMDKQMIHLSYERVTNPKHWDGYKENKRFLEEFRVAWKIFRKEIPEPYRAEFMNQVSLRKQPNAEGHTSEFRDLDLD